MCAPKEEQASACKRHVPGSKLSFLCHHLQNQITGHLCQTSDLAIDPSDLKIQGFLIWRSLDAAALVGQWVVLDQENGADD
jgi:hypothetical protein